MTILIFEDNLLWSSRLLKSCKALGHEPRILTKLSEEVVGPAVAIVNLGSHSIPVEPLVSGLKAKGIGIVAHAGHKEKELHELGRQLGCDRLATNSELTYKLEAILDEFSNLA